MQYLFPEEAVRDLYAIRPELKPIFEQIDKTLRDHRKELEKHGDELFEYRNKKTREEGPYDFPIVALLVCVLVMLLFILVLVSAIAVKTKAFPKELAPVPVQESQRSSGESAKSSDKGWHFPLHFGYALRSSEPTHHQQKYADRKRHLPLICFELNRLDGAFQDR